MCLEAKGGRLIPGRRIIGTYGGWLLLDSRVVDVPMTYNSTFVMLSSLKSLFFSSRKMSHDSRTLVEHKTPESNKSVPCLCQKIEKDDKYFFYAMKSSTKSTLTHHVSDVAVLLEHGASAFIIPAKE